MNKRYEDYDFPFDDVDEIEKIDEDGFVDFQDLEDLHNTEFANTNDIYPPRGSFTYIPTNQFLLPGLDMDETIKAFNKLNKYGNSENTK